MIYLSKRSFIWRKRSFIWMARLPPRQAGLHPSPVLETWPRQKERERWVCQILRARSSLLKIPKHRPKPTSSINSALTIWQDKRAQCGWKWPNWKHWQQGGTKCSSQILTKFPRADCCNELEYATRLIIITIIIITRPKPASDRQGLVGSWGQYTDEVSTFLVFLTSHFAPAALSSDLNQPGTINHDKNPHRIMKTHLEP